MGIQLSSNALLGLGIQQGSGATDYDKMAAGYEQYVSVNANYHYFPLSDLGFSPVKVQDNLPPEIGGRALPSGAFSTGVWGEGPVSLIPRLSNRLGWLLLASMGDVSTIANIELDNAQPFGGTGTPASSGVHSHIFRFQTSDQYFVPWVSLRRVLPHTTAANKVMESYQDGKVRSLTLTGASGAPVTCDMDMVARVWQQNYVFDYNPSYGTVTYDEFDDFAQTSCSGSVEIEGITLEAVSVAVTLTNAAMAPAQSIVIGTMHPMDFPVLGRVCQITCNVMMQDYDLYVATFKGSTAGTDSNVACGIYKGDIDVTLASQTYITGTTPYQVRIISNTAENNVAWQVRPLRIVPNRPIVLQLVGTVQSVESGYPLYIGLQNGTSSYALPTP